MQPRVVTVDIRKRSVDPSNTKRLRKAFRAAADLQLNQLRVGLRQAIVDMNVLGLSGPSNFTFMAPAARLNQFAGWLEAAANATLDARWWAHPWLDKATQHGLNSGQQEMKGGMFQPVPTTFESLHALARHELRGIIGVLVQKVVREAHRAAAKGLVPHKAFRQAVKPLDHDIRNRLQLFAQHFAVKGHVLGKVAYFRNAGVTHVGVDPELRVPRRKLHDTRYFHDEETEVSWVTEGDDDVCDDCEDMADGGPYTLDEVEDLIPLHPNCRCSITVFDDESGE